MVCPVCGGAVRHRDYVRRIVRNGGPEKKWIVVERFECCECRLVRRYLPEYLLPFKHYRKDIIEGFVFGWLTTDDLLYEDYPCDMTIKRWVQSHKLQRVG